MKKKKKESEVEIYLDNSDKQKTYKINKSETKDKILEKQNWNRKLGFGKREESAGE